MDFSIGEANRNGIFYETKQTVPCFFHTQYGLFFKADKPEVPP